MAPADTAALSPSSGSGSVHGGHGGHDGGDDHGGSLSGSHSSGSGDDGGSHDGSGSGDDGFSSGDNSGSGSGDSGGGELESGSDSGSIAEPALSDDSDLRRHRWQRLQLRLRRFGQRRHRFVIFARSSCSSGNQLLNTN